MNENKKIMPERFYSLDNTMSIEKIIQARDNNEPLIGKVVRWNSKAKCFNVNLGNDIYGIIPIEHASIYPTLLANGNITASVRSIIGKPACLTVLSIDNSTDNPTIILSRKNNMLSSVNTISNLIGETIECCVGNATNFGLFVDVGDGICGLIRYPDLCTPRVHNVSDIGIHEGDKIKAKIISVDENYHVVLNYKSQFENLAFSLNIDDLIEVTVLDPINADGYFAYINPNTTAVIDIPSSLHCNYGDKAIGRVKGRRPDKPERLRLTFVSFS